MKPSGEVIFGKKAIQQTWCARLGINEEGTRQGGALHPRGPLVAPLTYFFRLYIYPYTLKTSGTRIDREFRRQNLRRHRKPI